MPLQWNVGCSLPKLIWLLPIDVLPRWLRRPPHPEDGWLAGVGTHFTSVFGVAATPLVETADWVRLLPKRPATATVLPWVEATNNLDPTIQHWSSGPSLGHRKPLCERQQK